MLLAFVLKNDSNFSQIRVGKPLLIKWNVQRILKKNILTFIYTYIFKYPPRGIFMAFLLILFTMKRNNWDVYKANVA